MTLKIEIIPVVVHVDPEARVFNTVVSTEAGEWRETWANTAELQAYLRGLRTIQALFPCVDGPDALENATMYDEFNAFGQQLYRGVHCIPAERPAAQSGHELTPDQRDLLEAKCAQQRTPVLDAFGQQLYCNVCRSPQFQSPGGATCRNGHGGIEGSVFAGLGDSALLAPPLQWALPPPPAPELNPYRCTVYADADRGRAVVEMQFLNLASAHKAFRRSLPSDYATIRDDVGTWHVGVDTRAGFAYNDGNGLKHS